jgi:hypothetical protein
LRDALQVSIHKIIRDIPGSTMYEHDRVHGDDDRNSVKKVLLECEISPAEVLRPGYQQRLKK